MSPGPPAIPVVNPRRALPIAKAALLDNGSRSGIPCTNMKTSLHKGLLILMMLALALAPLRATWAMQANAPVDTADHCAQMQHDSEASDTDTMLHSQGTDSEPGHTCNGCCGSDCNAANCNACAHGASAAARIINASVDIPAAPHTPVFLYNYPERTITPPLRPPASL